MMEQDEGLRWEDEERERRKASKRASLMRVGRADCRGNEVLQSVIYERDWFNWRDSSKRESDAIYQDRAASRFYACLRALAFRVVEERRSHRLVPDRDAAVGETDPMEPLRTTRRSSCDLCERPGDRWFVLGSFNRDARLRDSRRRARARVPLRWAGRCQTLP